MRNYHQVVVLDYTIKNDRDIVELGTPNPNYDPIKNKSEPLVREFVDPIEIFREVRDLEYILGSDNPIVKAGKQVIERMNAVRQRKYFRKTA